MDVHNLIEGYPKNTEDFGYPKIELMIAIHRILDNFKSDFEYAILYCIFDSHKLKIELWISKSQLMDSHL